MTHFLELKSVSYSYQTMEAETLALKEISLQIEEGEFIAIVGPSGCGKSTLLNLICGLIQPDEGEILLKGKPMEEMAMNIGYMLQKDHLFEWRTIYSNVTLGLELQHKLDSNSRKRVDKMLKTYGLSEFAAARPSQLSGGMRQRAALIRTLAMEPELLLLDEPFSALDYQTRLSVCDDIYEILKKENKTAILVTHDLSEAISVGDRVVILGRRPAQIKNIITLSFDQDLTPIQRRNAKPFASYFNTIWKELQENECS
ncbi:Fe(3+) ions import ATP-binding protein FbpC [Clostridiales bacterium CHKCI001]|nr:Fe(3+) ions import ATP-binding protein FbpC [Clostridiales bacterium CHKCI001]